MFSVISRSTLTFLIIIGIKKKNNNNFKRNRLIFVTLTKAIISNYIHDSQMQLHTAVHTVQCVIIIVQVATMILARTALVMLHTGPRRIDVK